MARKIVVTSGKGGVGKTSIVANLGYRLSQMGKRVCLVDADFGLNNLDVVTGIENLIVYDVSDVLEGRCRAKQALVQSPANKNLYVMPSVNCFFKKEVSGKSLQELLVGLDASFDYIFIDCPAGVGEGFHTAVSSAEEAIVVTTSQISSLRDADKVLSNLHGYKLKSLHLAINRLRGDLVVSKRVLSPAEIEQALKTKLIGVIPEDDAIMLYNAGFIPPESPSQKAFKIMGINLVTGKDKSYDYASPYTGFFGSIRRGLKRTL